MLHVWGRLNSFIGPGSASTGREARGKHSNRGKWAADLRGAGGGVIHCSPQAPAGDARTGRLSGDRGGHLTYSHG